MFQRGRLIRESEWARVYEGEFDSRKITIHESKFLADGLKVSAASIRARWPDLSFEEKLDFANAFGAGDELTTEDEQVLDFLMENGDFPTWMAIALRLRLHSNKDRVLAFFVERIGEDHEYKANFFQSLSLMNDNRAIPGLRAAYDNYRDALGVGLASGAPPDYTDYLYCCEALWRIDGSPEYRHAIEEASKSPDKSVKALAETFLRKP